VTMVGCITGVVVTVVLVVLTVCVGSNVVPIDWGTITDCGYSSGCGTTCSVSAGVTYVVVRVMQSPAFAGNIVAMLAATDNITEILCFVLMFLYLVLS
jgi:hypothetical protein